MVSGAAGSLQHMLGNLGEVKEEMACQGWRCSLAMDLCAVIYCPSMSLVGTSALMVHMKKTNLLILPHCRCRLAPCIPAFPSHLHIQLTGPDCSLGNISPNCSPFSPLHSSPVSHTINLCRFKQVSVDKDREPQNLTPVLAWQLSTLVITTGHPLPSGNTHPLPDRSLSAGTTFQHFPLLPTPPMGWEFTQQGVSLTDNPACFPSLLLLC